jgi:hypothetical protein
MLTSFTRPFGFFIPFTRYKTANLFMCKPCAAAAYATYFSFLSMYVTTYFTRVYRVNRSEYRGSEPLCSGDTVSQTYYFFLLYRTQRTGAKKTSARKPIAEPLWILDRDRSPKKSRFATLGWR